MTRVTVLTPAGSGAIGTVSVAGPGAWRIARERFRPAVGSLADSPVLHRTWFGRFGDLPGDEVVLAVVGPDEIEIHCHGGRRVVRWVVEQCRLGGAVDGAVQRADDPWALLERAPTLRTAGILLDQCHGAFDAAVADLTPERLTSLLAFAPLGRHLIDPWRVVIAGPPNVGKSSLVNALAGYQRAVVSDIAGTTRDAATTAVAFDGWPVELTDTAGLRDTADPLEAEGVRRARDRLDTADLIVWLIDATDPHPMSPDQIISPARLLLVANKIDLAPVPPAVFGVSARTGTGVAGLTTLIAGRLVPSAPPPGAAVPYTPALADAVIAARVVTSGGIPAARDIPTTHPVPPPADPA